MVGGTRAEEERAKKSRSTRSGLTWVDMCTLRGRTAGHPLACLVLLSFLNFREETRTKTLGVGAGGKKIWSHMCNLSPSTLSVPSQYKIITQHGKQDRRPRGAAESTRCEARARNSRDKSSADS